MVVENNTLSVNPAVIFEYICEKMVAKAVESGYKLTNQPPCVRLVKHFTHAEREEASHSITALAEEMAQDRSQLRLVVGCVCIGAVHVGVIENLQPGDAVRESEEAAELERQVQSLTIEGDIGSEDNKENSKGERDDDSNRPLLTALLCKIEDQEVWELLHGKADSPSDDEFDE